MYQGTDLETLDTLTAQGPSLHVWHLMPLMALRIAERHGYNYYSGYVLEQYNEIKPVHQTTLT